MWNPPMMGHFSPRGQTLARAGFWLGDPVDPYQSGPQVPGFARGSVLSAETEALLERMQRPDIADLQRVDFMGNFAALQKQISVDIHRALTTANTAFPMRENLEAPARVLVPLQTPFLDRIPRVQGSGPAASWRQLSALGGGFGFTTTATAASSATQTVVSTAGFQVGDVVQLTALATSGANTIGVPIGGTIALSLRTVLTINSATSITFTATVDTAGGALLYNTTRPAGSGTPDGITGATHSVRAFFGETVATAPAEKTETYVAKSLTYKQLGTFGRITGRAMAAGASYQDQRAMARLNSIRNLRLNEENAAINGSVSSVAPPWGDYTNALGYDGITNLIATANGTPATHIQTGVGGLTLTHMDSQWNRIYEQGGTGLWALMSPQEAASLTHLAEAAGSIIRLQATQQGQAVLGLKVSGLVHPSSGEVADIIISRYLQPGTIIFGADRLPDGTNSLEMDVLPQADLPVLAPDEMIQGYTYQELAPTTADPLNYPWIVFLFEVLKALGATVFAKSSGITAV